jgi:hypothetical protein
MNRMTFRARAGVGAGALCPATPTLATTSAAATTVEVVRISHVPPAWMVSKAADDPVSSL